MALFYGQPCPLCGVKMTTADRRFATSHFIADPAHDLWQYSDAVMHWDCYARWEHRPRFARMFFAANRGWSGTNPYWGVALADEDVLVTANPDPYVGEVDVLLAATGSGARVPLADWEDWLGGEWFEACRHEVEREAMAEVVPRLRALLPTPEALASAAGMALGGGSPVAAMGGMVARVSHEFACQKLAERAATKGLACPRCGGFSTDYEFDQVESVSDSGPQSRLVCRGCGAGFGPSDV
jgi:hypothetical protein